MNTKGLIKPEMEDHYFSVFQCEIFDVGCSFHSCIVNLHDLIKEHNKAIQLRWMNDLYCELVLDGQYIGNIITVRVYD